MSRVSIHQTLHKGTHCFKWLSFNVVPLLKTVIDTHAGTEYLHTKVFMKI